MSGDAEFVVHTTPELTPQDVTAVCRLFEKVYAKPCPEDLFHRKFGRNEAEWSLHSLMFLEGELIGAFSAIPLRYRFFGETRMFAITADLMIDPQHRGPVGRLQKMTEALYKGLAAKGVVFVFCCLRNEIFQMHRIMSGWRAIGKVHYYVTPLRLAWLIRRETKSDAEEPAIEKINDAVFSSWRYGIFPANYQRVDLPGGGSAVYAAELFYPIAGVPSWLRLGLLIDVWPLTKENFDAAVAVIRRRERKIRVLAYQGSLPFHPREMLRIPEKYEKQHWTLAGRILNPSLVDERVFDIRAWNINLSDGDLV